ncbi:serine kinase [Ensifer canadensis]
MRFRLGDGVRCQAIGGRPTVFIESSQQLFEIDETTARVTSALSQAASVGDLEAALVGQGAGRLAARNYVRNYLHFWSRQGLLQVEFEKHEESPPHSHLVKIAERVIQISCYDESLLHLILPLFHAFGSPVDAASSHYALASFGNCVCIVTPGRHALVVDLKEAVPALKGHLTDEIIANLGTYTALHGALLANRSGAVLLCGSPGTGKTTLAFAMMQRGFQSHADDIALLGPEGAITGVPFAPALKQGSWKLLPEIREIILSQPVHRRFDGKRVRYLSLPPFETDHGLNLTTIVLLKRSRRAMPKVTPLEPLQVLGKLISEANNPLRRLSPSQFESMLRVATSARGIELVYSQLDAAAGELARFHDTH